VKTWSLTVVLALVVACYASGQAQPLNVDGQSTLASDKTQQTNDVVAGIPTFYAHSRQVIVEAEVWDKSAKKGERPWVGDEPLHSLQKDLAEHLPPVVRGLKSSDFHVFQDGVEQSINYFKEADFPTVDMTSRWYFNPSARGTWGIFQPFKSYDFPLASYLIGYVPPKNRQGECHTIRVVAQNHTVQVNRDRYCAPKDFEAGGIDAIAGKKLGKKIQLFANSSAHGSINVSMQAFTFWSSGILHLATENTPTGTTGGLPATDYTYRVEVHDSKAQATVQVATGFRFPELAWGFPCQKDAVLYILGMAYKTNGDIAGQFSDAFSCSNSMTWLMAASQDAAQLIPTWFGGQINLSPGDYDLRVVVTDGHDFGRSQMPLLVEPLDSQRLTMSDVVVGAVLRGAQWVLRDAASVAPSPVIPAPLVSDDMQFIPDADAPPRLGKHRPLFLYFEVYEPKLEHQELTVFYRARIANLKSGSLVLETGTMSAADWITPGNVVIPIGLKLATEKLGKGSYRLEIQASDSVGQETQWREVKFNMEW
jgi:hypothetical protein